MNREQINQQIALKLITFDNLQNIFISNLCFVFIRDKLYLIYFHSQYANEMNTE